jgi:hypothetical protein
MINQNTDALIFLVQMDTNMLFAAGKGDTTISFLEVTDKDPYLVEGIRHSGEQTKGACLVPKRALRVMEGEVNRFVETHMHNCSSYNVNIFLIYHTGSFNLHPHQ